MKKYIFILGLMLLTATSGFAQFTLNATVPAAADVCYAYGNFNSWNATSTQMTYVSTTGSTKLFTLNLPLTFVNSGTFQILAGPFSWTGQTDPQFTAIASGTSQDVTVTAFSQIQYYLTINVTVPLNVNECWGVGQWGWTLPTNAKQLFLKTTNADSKVFSNTFTSNATHSFAGKFLSGLDGSNWTYQQTQAANFTNPGTGNTINFTVTAFNAIYVPVTTAVENAVNNGNSIKIIDKSIIAEGVTSNVSIFDVRGSLIQSANTKGAFTSKTLNSGLYIVRIDGKTYKQMVD